MYMKKVLFTLFVLIFYVSACYYDSEESLFPNVTKQLCDTTNVTFGITISSILSSNCLGCHSNSNAVTSGGGFKLQDYADVKSQANLIYSCISHINAFPMPLNSQMLDSCSIKQFAIWIRMGTPEN